MYKILLSAFLLVMLHVVSCKPDADPVKPATKGNIRLKVNVTAGNSPFELNNSYLLADGQEYSFDILKFYLSDLMLVKADGSKVNIKDLLFIDLDKNMREPYDRNSIGTEFTLEVEAGNYKALELGVGVPKRMNVVSNDYENDHPLSVYRGTDWSWAGYRFIMIEGLSSKGGGEKTTFSYHIASDTFYQTAKLIKNIDLAAGTTQDLVLNLDINKLFRPTDQAQNIDPVNERITHSEGTEEKINLAWKVIRNFTNSIDL